MDDSGPAGPAAQPQAGSTGRASLLDTAIPSLRASQSNSAAFVPVTSWVPAPIHMSAKVSEAHERVDLSRGHEQQVPAVMKTPGI